jgi:hypothetical protein
MGMAIRPIKTPNKKFQNIFFLDLDFFFGKKSMFLFFSKKKVQVPKKTYFEIFVGSFYFGLMGYENDFILS